MLGITKAYATRVGGRPFPTELFDETGEYLPTGGTNSVRPPAAGGAAGWFDAVALRRSILNNSVTGLCVTKLDVLDGLDSIRMCVDYRCGVDRLDHVPLGAEALAACEPIYEEMPGWRDSTFGVRRYETCRPLQGGLSSAHRGIGRCPDRYHFHRPGSSGYHCAAKSVRGVRERKTKGPVIDRAFSIWCRREDLNLHRVTPTKTRT